MNPGVISTTIDESIYSIARAMKDLHIGSLVVVDSDDLPMGIITSSDIINKVVAENLSPRSVLVNEVMTINLIKGQLDDSMAEAAFRMTDSQIKKLPIIDNTGKLVGILTTTDISRFCAEQE